MLTCDEKNHMKTEENYLQYKYLPTSEKGVSQQGIDQWFYPQFTQGIPMMVSLSESLGFSGILSLEVSAVDQPTRIGSNGLLQLFETGLVA